MSLKQNCDCDFVFMLPNTLNLKVCRRSVLGISLISYVYVHIQIIVQPQ